ncbi:MAG: DUF362 domain-containing protein, partial [Methanomicrobiales archaeon]|nr:DUF362 domain-containing protein [Methanomicrobiales archaeon]
IFVVEGTNGNDGGIESLINLMDAHGNVTFYNSSRSVTEGRQGVISRDDVVIIKVNCQWDERGGTNTDLVRGLIRAIVEHPEGFTGEIVIADNGQGQYGPEHEGGSLSYRKNNAEDTTQSLQVVADGFAGSARVSTFLWDPITTIRVEEYAAGDPRDGFVVDPVQKERSGLFVSYPKFQTKYGTRISIRDGIWDPATASYDTVHLKIINMPVLKAHAGYGVSAAVKNYMGLTSDKLTGDLGRRSHFAVRYGGMGTEMVETRFPALSIIDAIWVNAHPGEGPVTSYDRATRLNTIVAGQDPVALDCWAAKHLLMPAAQANGYTDLSLIDPDKRGVGELGNWLSRSLTEIRRGGYPATMDEGEMRVFRITHPAPAGS